MKKRTGVAHKIRVIMGNAVHDTVLHCREMKGSFERSKRPIRVQRRNDSAHSQTQL